MEIPDDLAVDREVFMVLICHSIKPLDLGYKDEQVMSSIPCDEGNWEKGSEENGGPLLEKKHLGVAYCEKQSCNHWVILLEVLE